MSHRETDDAPAKHDFLNGIVHQFLGSNFSVILILVSLLIGLAALFVTPREEDPQIVVPMADVLVNAPGLSADEVEQLVATPLERILYQIDGVEYVYSMARENQAIITVRFYVGQDRERSLVKLFKRLDEHQDMIPPGVTGWVVKPVEIDDVPVVTLALTSGTDDSHALRRVGEEIVQRLSVLSNVSRAYLVGGEPRIVRVDLDPERLQAHSTSPLEIQQALQGANMVLPAGSFTRNDAQFRVKAGMVIDRPARQLGVSMFASLGNRADVSTNDLLECWEQDARTAAVVLYVESFGSPERFTRIARHVSRRKPILVVKGRRRAERVLSEARSHTAAALRGDAAVDALLYQAGVLRFRGGEELFDAAEFFERQPLPTGRRVGILSSSAGVATLAADACAARGLEVSETSEAQNPLILGISAGPDDYSASIPKLLGDAGIDALMVFYVDFYDGDAEAVLEAISAASAGQPKPVVGSVVGSNGRLPARTGLGVPNFLFPESCAAVLARAAERREWLSRPLGEPPQLPRPGRAGGACGDLVIS